MPEILEPGDRAPSSGLYKVVHAGQHAPPHYVTALYGDIFPKCLECVDEVRFELAVVAGYMVHTRSSYVPEQRTKKHPCDGQTILESRSFLSPQPKVAVTTTVDC